MTKYPVLKYRGRDNYIWEVIGECYVIAPDEDEVFLQVLKPLAINEGSIRDVLERWVFTKKVPKIKKLKTKEAQKIRINEEERDSTSLLEEFQSDSSTRVVFMSAV